VSINLILTDHPIRAAEALAIDLRDDLPSDIFQPQQVLLTDPSIESWLRTWLAHHTGVAANLELVPLREGLLDAWSSDGHSLEEPEPGVLAAAVVRAWGDLSDDRWAPLHEALERRGSEADRGARKAALAFQVAQWILESFWDGSQPDEASWLRATQAAVEDPRQRVTTSQPGPAVNSPVRVFASRGLTGCERALLERLEERAEVRVYRAVADPARWEAGEAPLPGSTAARLLAAQVAERNDLEGISVRRLESTWDWGRPATATLARWQQALRLPEACERTPVPAGDAFIPAWSPRREVEILRDRLLRRFSAKNGTRIEPRDVLVLTPDLSTYGPLVASIFSAQAEPMVSWGDTRKNFPPALLQDSAKASERDPVEDRPSRPGRTPVIPTRLVGLGLSQTNPVARALLDVLGLCADRVTAPALHALATMPVVRKRFGIPEGADEELFTLLQESNAAWGLDGDDKAEVYGKASHTNSLGFGVERLALSAFVHHEAADGDTAVKLGERWLAPLPAASREREQLSGALGRLMGTLRTTRAELRDISPGTGRQWRSLLETIIERFTKTGATTAWLTRGVLEAIEPCIMDGDDLSLDLEAVRRLLRSRFDLPISVKGDFGGVVRVQGLGPGAIPARPVVVFLGMNTGVYPHRVRQPEWRPDPPGPSAIDRQRQAFADAILAAGSELWVTWTAREPKKGQEQPPSSLVQELEDLLYPSEKARKKWREPCGRHAWSPGAELGFSAALAAARAQVVRAKDAVLPPHTLGQEVLSPAKVADDGRARTLELEALVGSLVNPSKTYLYRRLGVYLTEESEELPEREPLDASGLSAYGLRVEALAAMGETGCGCARDVERVRLEQEALCKHSGQLEAWLDLEEVKTQLTENEQARLVKYQGELAGLLEEQEALLAVPEPERSKKEQRRLQTLEKAISKKREQLSRLQEKESAKRETWESKRRKLRDALVRAEQAWEETRSPLEEKDAVLAKVTSALDDHASRALTQILAHHEGKGDVPLHVAGEQAMTKAVERVVQTLRNLGRANGDPRLDVTVSHELQHDEQAPVTLEANVPEVRWLGDGIVDGRRCLHQWMMLGSSQQKPYLRAWICLWLARAIGQPVCAARIVGAEGSEWLVVPDLPEGSESPDALRAQALAVLLDLLGIHAAALRRPLPLFKFSSLALAKELDGKEPREGTSLNPEALAKLRAGAVEKVASKWFLSPYNPFPDELDRWVATVHPGLDPSQVVSQHDDLLAPLGSLPSPEAPDAGFVELSRQLWAQLLANKFTEKDALKRKVSGRSLSEWILS